MEKRILTLMAIIMLSISVVGCGTQSKKDIEKEIVTVVNENLKSLEKENIEKYMNTMEIPETQAEQVRKVITQICEMYDLKYEINNLKVISTEENDAQVEGVQITKKVNGPDFQNNKLEFVHHLKKVDGKWKIFKTDLKKTENIE